MSGACVCRRMHKGGGGGLIGDKREEEKDKSCKEEGRKKKTKERFVDNQWMDILCFSSTPTFQRLLKRPATHLIPSPLLSSSTHHHHMHHPTRL